MQEKLKDVLLSTQNSLMMMYYKKVVGMLVIFFLNSACAVHSKVSPTGDGGSEMIPIARETTIEQFEGTFESVSGVMDKLSCYTSNGGYLTLSNGRVIMLSFEEGAAIYNCQKMKVKGEYVMKEIEDGEKNPCPAGQLTFFRVISFECFS